MTIKPLADRVVVKLVEAEEKTTGGIILTAGVIGLITAHKCRKKHRQHQHQRAKANPMFHLQYLLCSNDDPPYATGSFSSLYHFFEGLSISEHDFSQFSIILIFLINS